jgi:hypothetical protein
MGKKPCDSHVRVQERPLLAVLFGRGRGRSAPSLIITTIPCFGMPTPLANIRKSILFRLILGNASTKESGRRGLRRGKDRNTPSYARTDPSAQLVELLEVLHRLDHSSPLRPNS